ncbi:MAG: hypothetical protein PVJ30_05915 [Thiohalocapsa sp.]|jgi:hypothetical protein
MSPDEADTTGSAPPDPAPARIVHRTHRRIRLRVPSRRHDLPFFLALYDELRGHAVIDELTINPATGSVLLWLDPANEAAVAQVLESSPRLQVSGGEAGAEHHAPHISVNDMRVVVFLFMLGISVYQWVKGQRLAPAVTMLLYIVDLAAGIKLERDAATRPAGPAPR